MKGLIWGGVGAGLLEMTKLKSVTVGIWQRGRWDVVRFGRDEEKLEVQVKKDMMVDYFFLVCGISGQRPMYETKGSGSAKVLKGC